MEEDNRPQVTLDVDYENGMGISVGRIREDSVYDWKFVGLSHNTVRGAAGGAVLCAELLKAQDLRRDWKESRSCLYQRVVMHQREAIRVSPV